MTYVLSRRNFARLVEKLESCGIDPVEFVNISLPAVVSGVPPGVLNILYHNGILARGPVSSFRKRVWDYGCYWTLFKQYVLERYAKGDLRSQKEGFEKVPLLAFPYTPPAA